ncbi:hypothetical protein DV113_003314 [Geotrichum candidum]|uniref:Similar to Saccharomyces cerevisiae YGR166W TRS65 Subunit of TRAPPII, a multimeric guanine nucleotide-exchange factor for Ypt1p n=1 Tax=Geotrichum candidum TaxID=1173061 RepID=A0A0J9X389_GEOCN|nr:hypothetical protein DV452_002385 [Geotrichum candidum]KAF7498655.1 hypothetical protein DV113_003314 [Geotrichum candidum]KAI8135216.1 hypothetical protein DUD61_001073 [Geotrichum candidum]CDO51905.1 similar to Saccharomyces cerevisiae YGR166W TRS65 Subunit of TRAPPII, a multimeric guanine nucleotide-exchange factor for Ypt1p [Geotrichum candidum]
MDKDFFKNAVLSIRAPHLNDYVSPEDSSIVFGQDLARFSHVLQSKSRSAAFYDESLRFYVQLDIAETHFGSLEEFKIFVGFIKVLISTKVSGITGPGISESSPQTPQQQQPPQQKKRSFEIFTTVVDTRDALVYCGKNPDDEEKYSVLWQVSVDVSHPRIRLFRPQLVIDVTTSYDKTQLIIENAVGANNPAPIDSLNPEEETSTYLEEFMPAEEVNVFETLASDKYFKDVNAKLDLNLVTTRSQFQPRDPYSEDNSYMSTKSSPQHSRSSTPSQFKLQSPPPGKGRPHSVNDLISPISQRQQQQQQQEGVRSTHNQNHISTITSSIQLPVFPAVNLRLKCTKSAGSQDSIVAILDIENSESSQFNVLIKSAHMEFTAGSAVLFGDASFPLWLSPGENYSMAYNLSHADAGGSQNRVKPMTISLNSVPVLGDVSELDITNLSAESSAAFNFAKAGPVVVTRWDTVVDFAITATPSAAPSAPVSLGSASGAVKKLFKVSRVSSNTSLRSASGSNGGAAGSSGFDSARNSRSNTVTSQLNGFVISFTGPSTVKVGEVFKWKVFAINKSQQAKHLTLYIQPPEKGFRASAAAAAALTEKQLPSKPDLAPALDRTQLLKLYEDCQHIAAAGSIGIVSLMNDVRIGPLNAHACYETEISMLALVTGQYSLEGLCVIDLATGESYDCDRLLDVVITE